MCGQLADLRCLLLRHEEEFGTNMLDCLGDGMMILALLVMGVYLLIPKDLTTIYILNATTTNELPGRSLLARGQCMSE